MRVPNKIKKKSPPKGPLLPPADSGFVIQLGRIWVHRGNLNPYQELPLTLLTPLDDIHGELSFYIQGRRIPDMGYITYDQHARDGACLPEWILYLKDTLMALDQGPEVSYQLREYESNGVIFEFVRDQDMILFSVGNLGGGAEAGWEVVAFDLNDLWDQFEKFKDELLDQIGRANPAALVRWKNLF